MSNATGPTRPRVLVVDDDRAVRESLRRSLEFNGYDVALAADGAEALAGIAHLAPDVVVMDVMMPRLDGIEATKALRSAGNDLPILVLTARDSVGDRVDGLDAGADDYLAKPFDLDELLARLRALVRRSAYGDEAVVGVDDLVVDPAARLVARAGTPIELSAREFDILHLLVARVGRVVTRYTILDEVWDGETDLQSNVIDVHLASIRAKIDRPFGTSTITTVRGAGYRVDPRAAP